MKGFYETDPKFAFDNSKSYPTAFGALAPIAYGDRSIRRSDIVGVSKQDGDSKVETPVARQLPKE